MQDIKGLALKELEGYLLKWKYPAFHARQIFSWIYKRGISDFSRMTDLSVDLRLQLEKEFYLSSLKLKKEFGSIDGTQKFLFELSDGSFIEAVIIPQDNRITGCISTQVGCKFLCSFCASGKTGFKRNLAVAEIIEQVLCLKAAAANLTHLVFMGIGEPLDNYDNLIKAIRIINSKEALCIGARRITISTSGLIPGIKRLAQEALQVELSVSLHAASSAMRSQIMPINKKYPLPELIKACKDYIHKTDRQITFEYILIKGLNSDLQSAEILSKILKGLNCKVNLIPSNPIKEFKVEPPQKLEVLLFKDYLTKHGINVTLRKLRGEDIEAACGQLRLRYEKSQ